MKLLILMALLLTSLNSFAFEGIYIFDLPAEKIELEIHEDGSFKILSNPRNLFTVALKLHRKTLDITFSWINDASPEVSRVILVKNIFEQIIIKDSFTVYNDGDPQVSKGGVTLDSFKKILIKSK